MNELNDLTYLCRLWPQWTWNRRRPNNWTPGHFVSQTFFGIDPGKRTRQWSLAHVTNRLYCHINYEAILHEAPCQRHGNRKSTKGSKTPGASQAAIEKPWGHSNWRVTSVAMIGYDKNVQFDTGDDDDAHLCRTWSEWIIRKMCWDGHMLWEEFSDEPPCCPFQAEVRHICDRLHLQVWIFPPAKQFGC